MLVTSKVELVFTCRWYFVAVAEELHSKVIFAPGDRRVGASGALGRVTVPHPARRPMAVVAEPYPEPAELGQVKPL